MIDENAFGALFSYHGLEDDEYEDDDLERVVQRITAFQQAVREFLRETPPGEPCQAIDLGHAVYVELADGDQSGNLMSWLKQGAARLKQADLNVACFLTHGGRWVDEAAAPRVESVELGPMPLTCISKPSEPLRRALYADTASHGLPSEEQAWGPGVYVDVDAVEALGLSPKNKPTSLPVAGAEFYRIGG